MEVTTQKTIKLDEADIRAAIAQYVRNTEEIYVHVDSIILSKLDGVYSATVMTID